MADENFSFASQRLPTALAPRPPEGEGAVGKRHAAFGYLQSSAAAGPEKVEGSKGFKTPNSPTTSYLLDPATVIWLRLPPPADANLFAALDRAGNRVLNAPRGILETGSKDFLVNFPDWTTDIELLRTYAEVEAFTARFPAVLKPLREYGGRGILRVEDGLVDTGEGTLPLLPENIPLAPASEPQNSAAPVYLGMRYLKNVSEGDKRILVVNGRILGASVRLPAPGKWLCNVSQGGRSEPAEPTERERAMIAAIAPVLLQKGVVIFGADTLVDDAGRRVLSELNTNSIGGFPQAEAQSGRPVLQQTIDGLYDFLAGAPAR